MFSLPHMPVKGIKAASAACIEGQEGTARRTDDRMFILGRPPETWDGRVGSAEGYEMSERSFPKTSSMTTEGKAKVRSARQARQSRLTAWSAKMTPATG